jgi:TRAP-type C4-dicarboxylate transport system substrate-binding protein
MADQEMMINGETWDKIPPEQRERMLFNTIGAIRKDQIAQKETIKREARKGGMIGGGIVMSPMVVGYFLKLIFGG